MKKKIIYLLMIFLAVFASIFFLRKTQNRKVLKINLSYLPIKNLNEISINLKTFYGKPLVINYWATWCGPCREEFPILEKLYKKYADRVNFLAISAEPLDKIIAFKNTNKYSLPFAQSQKQLNELGIISIPVTTIYSAQGTLLITKDTPLNEDELDKLITDLIK